MNQSAVVNLINKRLNKIKKNLHSDQSIKHEE